MFDDCPTCNLRFEREQGYFIGAMYINYAATVAIAVPGYLLLDVFASLTINQQLALWVPFAVIFPLLFFTTREVSGLCSIIFSTQPPTSMASRPRKRRTVSRLVRLTLS